MSAKEQRHPNVMNAQSLSANEIGQGERFAARRTGLSSAAGGQKLGCSLYEVPPGKTAFPYHLHHGNEESIYVLEGGGDLRMGAEKVAVVPGDYIVFPAGGPAHQLIAGGQTPLRYLCISTMIAPEVVEYPDSAKFGAMAGAMPGTGAGPTFRGIYKKGATVDYYEGE